MVTAQNREKWTGQNLVVSREEQISFQPQKERILQKSQKKGMKNHCVCCKANSQNATDCKKVTHINQQKWIVAWQSICYKLFEWQPSVFESHQKQSVMTAKERDVIYPVVVVLAHSVHLGINPPPYPSPQKHHHSLSFQALYPPVNLQTIQALYTGFSWPPLPKTRIFPWIPKIFKFFILRPILSFKSN